MNKKYAVYSEKQAECSGVIWWENVDGKRVLVTAVSDKPGCPSTKCDDKQDLGEVKRFIKRISSGRNIPEFLQLKREVIE